MPSTVRPHCPNSTLFLPTRKSKEDGDLCLNTESGDTANDSKKCAGQFAKAFNSRVEKLRSQSEPKENKP
jgi:DNA polymerase II small subunit/DNA polymerase delta subunit B